MRIDQVFGRMEKDIKSKELLPLPNNYRDIMKNHVTLLQYPKDFTFFDYKSESNKFVQSPLKFMLSDARMLVFYNDCMVGFNNKNYKVMDCSKFSFIKRGFNTRNLAPSTQAPVNKVSEEKKEDMLKLVQMADLTVEQKAYYESILK